MECSTDKSLTDLPEEILINIIQSLDIKSKLNIYNTCKYLRYVVCIRGVTKICDISLTCLAGARQLKSSFFRDISSNLLELNLTGINDLSKTLLVLTLKKMKTLRNLNVSYTRVSVKDLPEIHTSCPTIKSIAINLLMTDEEKTLVAKNILQYQNIFKNFENVHLVGLNLLYSNFVPCLLSKTKLKKLKLTEYSGARYLYLPNFGPIIPIEVNYFFVLILHEFVMLNNIGSIFTNVETSKYEFMVIRLFPKLEYNIFASPVFETYLQQHLKLNVTILPEMRNWSVTRTDPINTIIMLWNKETTEFDLNFFSKISQYLKRYLPYHVQSCCEILAPLNFNWYCIQPELTRSPLPTNSEPEFKKKRTGLSKVILNYNDIFKDKFELQLSLIFTHPAKSPVTLSANCDYLKKITYLSLAGDVTFSDDFFNVLFHGCNKLVTLSLRMQTLSASLAVSRSIHLTKSLQNFRFITKRINFEILFQSISQCKTLENVCIMDLSTSNTVLYNPSIIFKNCPNLYNFYLHLHMNATTRRNNFQLLKKARAKCRRHNLNIALNSLGDAEYGGFYYYPYISVFKTLEIKNRADYF